MAERGEEPKKPPKRSLSKDSMSDSGSPRTRKRFLRPRSPSTSVSDEGGGGEGGGKLEDSTVVEESKEQSHPEADQQIKKKEKEKKGFFSSSPLQKFPFTQLFASHRHKNNEIHKIFKTLPESEKLIDDYSCALQRDILIHGRLYVTQKWLCFYANIFSWETLLTIPFQSVQAITKEKTALVIPNAIQISTTAEKYGFSSLINRDVTYKIIFRVWQNCLLDQTLTPLELVKAAKKAWGESTDVGTAEELWGCSPSEHVKPKKQMSLPTHLEIGVLPASTVQPSPLPKRTPSSSLPTTEPLWETSREDAQPGETEKASQDAKATNHVSASDQDVTSNPTPLPSPLPSDHQERASMGAESITSSEFETVSFTEENGEIDCGCTEHTGRTIVNEIFSADVETIFQLLFTDSDFMRNFFKARKTTNIELTDWQPQTDGTKLRDLSYTLALNYSFGPKYSPSTEHQVYSKHGQPGLKHIVDTEVVNGNIPYSDTFFVSCRYCMTRVAHDKTRVRITATINFKKTCWGLVKNLIERNAGDGVRSYFNHLDQFLKEYLGSLPAKKNRGRRRASRHTSRTRHRRQPSLTKPMSSQPPSQGGTPPNTPGLYRQKVNSVTNRTTLRSFQTEEEDRDIEREPPEKKPKESHSRVNLALTLLLGILILSNMALYHQLMSYQTLKPSQSSVESSTLTNQRPIEWPTSRDEWITLVRYQLEGHDRDVQHWKEALSGLIQSLDQIEATVGEAKKRLMGQLEGYSIHAKRQAETIRDKHNAKTEPNKREEL